MRFVENVSFEYESDTQSIPMRKFQSFKKVTIEIN